MEHKVLYQLLQFVDQLKIRLISQLISGISRVLWKVLKYFNGTDISTFTVPVPSVLFKELYLNWNESESAVLLSCSSLQYGRKLPDVFQQILLYYINLFIGIITSRPLALSAWLLFISFKHLLNSAQLLTVTYLSSLSSAIAIAPAACPATVIVPLASVYASPVITKI